MTSDKTLAPYGLWDSPFEIEGLFAQTSSPMYPFVNRGDLYWLEALPDEGGRIGLVAIRNAERVQWLPGPFNIRSHVHEYGGKCFVQVENGIVFNNFNDGRLYFLGFDSRSDPICLTNGRIRSSTQVEPEIIGYADLIYLAQVRQVVAVCEAIGGGGQNENFICSVSLSQIDSGNQFTNKLVYGDDFYASPVVNVEESQLAWLQWSHPHMQWDQSRLMIADLGVSSDGLFVKDVTAVIDQPHHSVSQPGFVGTDLVFACDHEGCNFSNLFGFRSGQLTQLTDEQGEFGEAHWVFGQSRWQPIGGNILVAVETRDRGDRLVLVDMNQNTIRASDYWYAGCNHLVADGEQVLLVTSFADRGAAITRVCLDSLRVLEEEDYAKDAARVQVAVNAPESIRFPTRDGEHAYGYFYSPHNERYSAPEGSAPPLLVMVHGGPTSRATMVFSPLKHYFASLGFALLDVNHRGSTGYGRQYRQKLLGRWGEIDVSDIADGVRYLLDSGRVNGNQVFIRGGSAGGYAVLRALTENGELFAGGACYYGIGNLITLSEITHKFESRYTDGLIGEPFDPQEAKKKTSLYYQRSPIFHIERLVSPLILFQGLEDKVVPPEVSQELVEVLAKKHLFHRYFEYAGEGHGFRMSQTRVHSLTEEVAFFAHLIREQLDH